MKLVIGLGNPGSKYERTRHNAGFWLVDKIVQECGSVWDDSKLSKFSGVTAKSVPGGDELVFLKPMTFMNLSGSSVQKVAQFFKISSSDWIVLHDDIDLPEKKVRAREGGGGHGGHNGLRSIMEVTGKSDFQRIKLGVGRPTLVGESAAESESAMSVADYVLKPMAGKDVEDYVITVWPEVKTRFKDLLKR